MTTAALALPVSAARTGDTLTTCPYCGVGCGVRVSVTGNGTNNGTSQPLVNISGDAQHPANKGRLCVKGSALGETIALDGRLLYPQQRDSSGALQRVSWERALEQVAEGLRSTIARHGPDSVALYVSGQLLTEDYYIANKLMKGFIGSANIDVSVTTAVLTVVAFGAASCETVTVIG